MKILRMNQKKNSGIAFLRVSTTRQADGISHEVQMSQIETYCKDEGIGDLRVITLSESAKNSVDRKRYQESRLAALREGIFHFLFYQTDREARNFRDMEENEDLARQGLIELHYVRDRKRLNSGSPESDFIFRAFQALQDRSYSRINSQKVRDALTKKAESGWWPGSQPPLGYQLKAVSDSTGRLKEKGKILAVDPKATRWVQREFELRAKGFSFEAIYHQCVEEGLFDSGYSKSYSRSCVEKRLKNPLYWGKYFWNGIEYQGNHELIIPELTLQRVTESFRAGGRGKSLQGQGVFSGFIKCANEGCGCGVIYDPKIKTSRRKGTSKLYRYYHCSDGRRVHRKSGVGVRYLTEENLFNQFSVAVDSIAITEVLARQISKALNEAHLRLEEASKEVIKKCENEILDLRNRESLLVDLLMNKTLDQEAFELKRNENKVILQKAFEKLKTAQSAVNGDYRMTAEKMLALTINAKLLWESRSREEKVEFLKLICSDQWLMGSTIRFELKKPLAVLAEMAKNGNWLAGRDSNPRPGD